jgi:transmembrane sensor
MDISNYTAEDFVLDPSFREWVLRPNAEANLHWERILATNPTKYMEAEKAREIIVHLTEPPHQGLSDTEFWGLWTEIEADLTDNIRPFQEEKVIPLNAGITLRRKVPDPGHKIEYLSHLGFRVACVLALAFGLGFMASYFISENPLKELPAIVFEERSTDPGVKAHLTLSDGSQVILNSGSTLKYIRNFEEVKREVILKGEAFFNVEKDSLRPFTVVTGGVKTTALGTSFNIKSYEEGILDISLLTGKVAVEAPLEEQAYVTLIAGEAVNIDVAQNHITKDHFDEEMVVGWTKKILVFQKTPFGQAIRTLENWYGVQFEVVNKPATPVLFSGKFDNETLEIVLEGLSYAAKFNYEINEDKVKIKF